MTPLDDLAKVRYSSDLSCAREYFAGDSGVCVDREAVADQEGPVLLGSALRAWLNSFTGYSAVVFDERLHAVSGKIKLQGLPSRVRVSPDGRLAAVTVFLSGHSYSSLTFSTQTTIIDVPVGKVLADLESFSVKRNGEVFQSPDFNFWGVTFTNDANRFYATLWSKGRTYLVECDLVKRVANVIYDGVECPSLSPDGKRIAFKRRIFVIGAPTTWRLDLLDLRTMRDTPLGETRSVDDQVEWLDNDHILYALAVNDKNTSEGMSIWALPIDPSGSPSLLIRGGSSPAVVKSTN